MSARHPARQQCRLRTSGCSGFRLIWTGTFRPRAKGSTQGIPMLLQVRQRVDSVEFWVQRRLDRGRLRRGRLPQVDFIRPHEVDTVDASQHLHTRPVRIWCVRTHHDGDITRSESDEVACGVDANELRESPYKILIELRSIVALENRENAVRRKRLLV